MPSRPGRVHIYCDESGHLEHDAVTVPVMVLGAVWHDGLRARHVAERIREIKAEYGLNPHSELKWSKVSRRSLAAYRAILDYFFDDDDLHFRAVVIPDKSALDHERFDQDHDRFYYKCYFTLLKQIIDPDSRIRVFVDLKDTRGGEKLRELHQILANSHFDFDRRIIESIDQVRSEHVEQVQLADLLIGAVAYANRGLTSSPPKLALVDRLRKRSGRSLTQSTLLRESKLNILIWNAS